MAQVLQTEGIRDRMSDDIISKQKLLNRTINNPLHAPYITERDVMDCPSAQTEPCAVGYVGIEDDYPVSVKQVLNITAETGALTTQMRVRELPRYAQQEEDCDTCKYGYFGDLKCDNCRVGYPSHYERDETIGNNHEID